MDDLKEKNQTVTLPIKQSTTFLTLRLFLVMIFLDSIYLLSEIIFLRANLPLEFYNYIKSLFLIAHTIKSLLEIYFILQIVIKWTNGTYLLNGRHLIKQEGFLNSTEKIYDLGIIRSVTVNQGLLGKILNYGDIIITTSASGGYNAQIYLNSISHPEKYEQLLEQYL